MCACDCVLVGVHVCGVWEGSGGGAAAGCRRGADACIVKRQHRVMQWSTKSSRHGYKTQRWAVGCKGRQPAAAAGDSTAGPPSLVASLTLTKKGSLIPHLHHSRKANWA